MQPKNRLSSAGNFALLAATVLTVALGQIPARASADAPTILLDGQRVTLDVPPAVSGGHVLVPLRGVFERFGAAVSFDDQNQLAIAVLGDVTVKVSLRSPDAWINGEHRTLEVGAREIAGRTLVPLRFVSEALGISVDYDAAQNTVVIVSGFKSGNFAAATASEQAGSAGGFVSYTPKRAPSVEDESPQQGELIGSQYPQIYARFAGGTSAVNPASVTLTVDGQDVTGSSTISSAYASYTPQYGLQTGTHTVEINGAADDGTPFSDTWTFRVDSGSSSIYMPSGGGGFGNYFDGFNSFWFPRFRFFPPGFSVFTPGPLFFVSGGVIEVIFVSHFFPFGNGFFSISGLPGSFPLTPWPGNPGFFWGFTTVPFGARSHRAIIAAHFGLPNGHSIVVHSTAPLEIEGNRRELPESLRYAVLPRLLGRPISPHRLVVFRRLQPVATTVFSPSGSQLRVFRGNGATITIRSVPSWSTPRIRTLPIVRRVPIVQRLPVVMQPQAMRAPIFVAPARPIVPQFPVISQPVRLPAPAPHMPTGGKPKPK